MKANEVPSCDISVIVSQRRLFGMDVAEWQQQLWCWNASHCRCHFCGRCSETCRQSQHLVRKFAIASLSCFDLRWDKWLDREVKLSMQSQRDLVISSWRYVAVDTRARIQCWFERQRLRYSEHQSFELRSCMFRAFARLSLKIWGKPWSSWNLWLDKPWLTIIISFFLYSTASFVFTLFVTFFIITQNQLFL